MRLPLLVSCAFLCILAATSFGQDSISTFNKVVDFPTKFLDQINKKASGLEEKIIAKTEKALLRLEKQEQKLKRKLAKTDSIAAVRLFSNSISKYKELRQGLTDKSKILNGRKQYLPYFDTLKTSLNFLSQTDVIKNIPLKDVEGALSTVKDLDSRLQYAEQVRAYMRERRQLLKEQLGNLGFVKELKKYNKEVYYYSEQIKEYKAILQDPEKLERKAISLLQKLPIFQKFMQEHSELASLFPLPDNYGTALALQGLQTRASVQNMIQQQMQAGGPNAQAMMQQGIRAAQGQLRQIKDKLNQMGGMSSDTEIPDFKPNTQKTKSFWNRLEYGTNMQNTRSSDFLPTTTDFGLSMGYKINDKSVFGIGASYKMGWGKDIQHVTITNEGIGLRSYLDWKLKGSFYVSGGYEQNYRQQFDNAQQLQDPTQWQSSGLIGVTKKYSIGKKWKGDLKLLFDFLYNSHSPQTQPILFRFGYGF